LSSLADLIEQHIISLLERGNGVAEVQRTLLAEQFRCVPSQITYVLTSRFSPERGYIVESKRGGGGYIRVVKVGLEEDVRNLIGNIGSYLSEEEAYGCLLLLLDEGYLDRKAFEMLKAAVSRKSLPVGLPLRDLIRASIFKAMLNAYFSVREDKE